VFGDATSKLTSPSVQKPPTPNINPQLVESKIPTGLSHVKDTTLLIAPLQAVMFNFNRKRYIISILDSKLSEMHQKVLKSPNYQLGAMLFSKSSNQILKGGAIAIHSNWSLNNRYFTPKMVLSFVECILGSKIKFLDGTLCDA
jgi:hypothetical protein